MTPPDDRRSLVAAVLLGVLAFAVLVTAHGRCASWNIDAPPPAGCTR